MLPVVNVVFCFAVIGMTDPTFFCAKDLNSQALVAVPRSTMSATAESLAVCAVQLELRPDHASLMDATIAAVGMMERIAATEGRRIDLFVLPELAPVGYSEDTFARYLPRTQEVRDMFMAMDRAFEELARQLGTHICYGTIGWRDSDGSGIGDTANTFTIRQKVVDPRGQTIAIYDKIHLCDYGDCAETRFFTPGPYAPVAFSIGSFRFGLLLCADIRYPELSRRLVRDENVDVLLQPAAFNRDITFRTWTSFRETRAVENSAYFVAVNYCGAEYGMSSIVPPWVDEQHEPLVARSGDSWLVGVIHRDALNWARKNMPFYKRLMSGDRNENK